MLLKVLFLFLSENEDEMHHDETNNFSKNILSWRKHDMKNT